MSRDDLNRKFNEWGGVYNLNVRGLEFGLDWTKHFLKYHGPGPDYRMDLNCHGLDGLDLQWKLVITNMQITYKLDIAYVVFIFPDCSWLNVTTEGFESMLQHKFGSMHGGPEKPEDIPQNLREFMGRMAELEGVDLPS